MTSLGQIELTHRKTSLSNFKEYVKYLSCKIWWKSIILRSDIFPVLNELNHKEWIDSRDHKRQLKQVILSDKTILHNLEDQYYFSKSSLLITKDLSSFHDMITYLDREIIRLNIL